MAKLKNTIIKKIDTNTPILEVKGENGDKNILEVNDGVEISGDFTQTGNVAIGPNDNLKITINKNNANKISLKGDTDITGKLVQTGDVLLGDELLYHINIKNSEDESNISLNTAENNSIILNNNGISLNGVNGNIFLNNSGIELNKKDDSNLKTSNTSVTILNEEFNIENKRILEDPNPSNPIKYCINNNNRFLLNDENIQLGRLDDIEERYFYKTALAYCDIKNSFSEARLGGFPAISTIMLFAGDTKDKPRDYSEIKLGIEDSESIGISITNKNDNKESSLKLKDGSITISGQLLSSSGIFTDSIKPYNGDIYIGGKVTSQDAYIKINQNNNHENSVNIFNGVYVNDSTISFKKPIDSFRFQNNINFYKESNGTFLTKTVFNKFQSLDTTEPDALNRKMFTINKFSNDSTENILINSKFYAIFAVIPFSRPSFAKHNCISVADFYNNYKESHTLINKIKITVSDERNDRMDVFLGYQSRSGSEAFYKLTLPPDDNFFNLTFNNRICNFYANYKDEIISCTAINAIYLCYDIDGFLNKPVISSTAGDYSKDSIITLSYDILKNNNKVAVDDNSVAIGTDVNNVDSIFIGTRRDSSSSNALSAYAKNYGLLSDIAIGKNIDTLKVVDSSSNASEMEYNRVIIGNSAGVTGYGGVAIGREAKTGSGTNINAGDQGTNNAYLCLGVGGQVWAKATGATSGFATTSDYRDKTDFKPIESALSFINSLEPLTFRVNPRYKYYNNGEFQEDDYKSGKQAGHRRLAGFKAQDVYQKMIDEYHDDNYAQIVDYSKYDNPEDTNDVYSIYTSSLVPFLTRAIQEQEEIINKLEERIIALEKQLKTNKEKE